MNTLSGITAGINESVATVTVSAYPNPVKDILKVNSEEVIQSIVVYNMMGQKVYETAVHNMQAEINVSVLDAGYYVLKMTKGDGSTVARKITKM